MLDTLKTAGRIWISSFRFMVRSPWLIFVGYLVILAIEYVPDAIDDLSGGEATWLDDSVRSYVILGLLGLLFVMGLGLFHLYGMRYAMRFATGRVDKWTPLTWCKRLADYVIGLGVYLGLSLSLMPIVVSMFVRLNGPDSIAIKLGYADPVDYFSAEYLAMCLACCLLACVVVYIIVRLSLWLPMAAFRRDDQWSVVLAWTYSRSKVLLLISTLVLLEFVAAGLMLAEDSIRGFRGSIFTALSEANVPGRLTLDDHLSLVFGLVSTLSAPALFCAVFAIRTSVAANLLGIREPGAQDAYFSYKSRAVPRRTNLSDLS